jgi:hypothetical protein
VDPDAAVLIVPALLYLMLSGRVNELKGPAGPEVRLSEIADQTIPVPGKGTARPAPSPTRSFERSRLAAERASWRGSGTSRPRSR